MKNIYLIGFMGTGKSTVARAIAQKCEQNIIDTDHWIEKKMHMSIPDIFQSQGEEEFRKIETQALHEIAKESCHIVACGGGVAMREENVAIMKESGRIVLLTATPQTVLKRVAHDTNRPILQGRKTIEGITELMNQRMDKYLAAADMVVTTDDRDSMEIADEILQRIH